MSTTPTKPGRCPKHPGESATACFSCYLSQPCDDCDSVATHSGTSKVTGKSGRFCNTHCSWDRYAHALND